MLSDPEGYERAKIAANLAELAATGEVQIIRQ